MQLTAFFLKLWHKLLCSFSDHKINAGTFDQQNLKSYNCAVFGFKEKIVSLISENFQIGNKSLESVCAVFSFKEKISPFNIWNLRFSKQLYLNCLRLFLQENKIIFFSFPINSKSNLSFKWIVQKIFTQWPLIQWQVDIKHKLFLLVGVQESTGGPFQVDLETQLCAGGEVG